MTKPSDKATGTRVLVSIASFVVVVAGLKAAQSLVVPFLLSVFIAVICAPPLNWLRKKGVPTALAILVVITVLAALGVALIALVGNSVDDFLKNLPSYQERLRGQMTGTLSWLEEKGVFASGGALEKHFNPQAAMSYFAAFLNGLGGMFSNAFLILLTVIFILVEASGFPTKVKAISGESNASLENLNKVVDDIRRYMAIKTWISLFTGILITLWLIVLGVDYAILWGLLAFLLNFVPNIGSIIAAVPTMVLAFVQLGTASALYTALGYLVVNTLVGNLIEPRFMGRGLGLSTLIVFLSLVFWGWVLGPVGMLLSVPLTMTVKIALESAEDTRWIAILIGSDLPPTPSDPTSDHPIG